jgi:hypothetical protein
MLGLARGILKNGAPPIASGSRARMGAAPELVHNSLQAALANRSNSTMTKTGVDRHSRMCLIQEQKRTLWMCLASILKTQPDPVLGNFGKTVEVGTLGTLLFMNSILEVAETALAPQTWE